MISRYMCIAILLMTLVLLYRSAVLAMKPYYRRRQWLSLAAGWIFCEIITAAELALILYGLPEKYSVQVLFQEKIRGNTFVEGGDLPEICCAYVLLKTASLYLWWGSSLIRNGRAAVQSVIGFLVFPTIQLFILVYPAGKELQGKEELHTLLIAGGTVLGVAADRLLWEALVLDNIKLEKYKLQQITGMKRLREEAGVTEGNCEEGERDRIRTLKKEIADKLDAAEKELRDGYYMDSHGRIEELWDRINEERTMMQGGRAIMDAVLCGKEKECSLKGINLVIQAEGMETGTIEPIDLCSVLSNLLDNAIEASGLVPALERKIEVYGGNIGDYLIVKVVNRACSGNGGYKRDGRGYGKLILEDIARKYQGSYTCEWKDGIYTAVISLLMNENPGPWGKEAS